jgi:hypothetical protein
MLTATPARGWGRLTYVIERASGPEEDKAGGDTGEKEETLGREGAMAEEDRGGGG